MRDQSGQSTLEWVMGAAVILGTLLGGVVVWNQGLVAKLQQMAAALSAAR